MNCKQGEMAFIVHGPFVGFVIKCVQRYDGPWFEARYEPGWIIEWDRKPFGAGDGIIDAFLRPIRDPGEDAKDQTLEWLPSPSKQKEIA